MGNDTGQRDRDSRAIQLTLCLVVALGAIVRLVGLDFCLPQVFCRPDEQSLVILAVNLYEGDLNPRFFAYPSVYIYLLGALYAPLHLVSSAVGPGGLPEHAVAFPHALFLTARLISVVAGTATIVAVYAAAAQLFDRATGLASAWFLALAFLHVRESHFATTDALMTMLVAGAFLWAIRAQRTRSIKDLWFAGALAGLATSTKYNAATAATFALIAIAPPSDGRIGRALRGLVVYGVAFGSAFFVGTPYALLDWPTFLAHVSAEAGHLRAGHGVDLGLGWFHHASMTLPGGLGWPLFLSALGGLVALVIRGDRRALALGLFPVIYYAVAGSGRTVFVRYMLPLVPFLCMAAGVAATSLARLLHRAGVPFRWRTLLALLALALVAQSAARVAIFDQLMTRSDSRLLAAQWLRDHAEAGASVGEPLFYGTVVGWNWQLSGRFVVWPYDERSRSFVSPEGAAHNRPDWIIVTRSPLELYSRWPAGVAEILDDYELAKAFIAANPEESQNVFDRQDAFFVPYVGFRGVVRPGPNIYIHKRRP